LLLPQAKALYKFVRSPAQSMDYVSRTARYIQENTNPDDRVLVLGGQCGINLMSNRSSIDGALFYPLINNSPLGLKLQTEYFQNLKDQKPVYIVDGFALYPWHLPAIDPDNRLSKILPLPFLKTRKKFSATFGNIIRQCMKWKAIRFTASIHKSSNLCEMLIN